MAIRKKKIRFNLPINNEKVKTVDELREHITFEIIDLFKKQTLIRWLKQINEDEVLALLYQVNQYQDDKLLFIDIVKAIGNIEINDQIIDELFEKHLKMKSNIQDIEIYKINIDVIEIRVPDISGHSDVNVAEVYAKVGDKINIDDNLIMLETDKAAMEVPADKAGVITEVLVQVGSKVNEGDLIAKLEPL